ncbi:SDR family NAD(P)-dependent oxidoreductase [Pseudoroseomonas globiformis]|uniref:SDR family NAD(P)-dependent oxidoreductase n=1 Tax=Teichococcus globiformis TaxID=2307229 RepID=A0ABV7FVR2_9PROT
MSQPKVILITEAPGSLGNLTAGALGHGGHTVYAALQDCRGGNRAQATRLRAYAREQGIDIRPIELNPTADRSATCAIARILREQGRIDVILHNALPRIFGPAEAFSTAQLARAHDRSILGTQRLMRAALPAMRRQSQGLMAWLISSASTGGAAPYLAFHCAIVAGLEAMAVQYAREIAPWGIESSIVVAGMFSEAVMPLTDALQPDDTARVTEYEAGATQGLAEAIREAVRRVTPAGAILGAAAGAVAMIVDLPAGERPFRFYVDPVRDGAEVVIPVMDRVRDEMIGRLGLTGRLAPP